MIEKIIERKENIKRLTYCGVANQKIPQWQRCLAWAWTQRHQFPFVISTRTTTILKPLESRGYGRVWRRSNGSRIHWGEVILTKEGWKAAKFYYEKFKKDGNLNLIKND